MTDAMVAREQLRSIVERIERLEEEKKAIADDIRDVYAEAKASGFDTKVLRLVVKLRKMDMNERQEVDAVTDLYLQSLGMLPSFEADYDEEDIPTVPSVPTAPPQVIVQQPQVQIPAPPAATPNVPYPPGYVPR